MKVGTRVQHVETDKMGIVALDVMSCCDLNEVPVVWDGFGYLDATDADKLKDMGPVDHKPEYSGCGAGKGADCCIYLVMGFGGFECQRFGPLRNSLMFKSGMKAQRVPEEVYPDCMNQ